MSDAIVRIEHIRAAKICMRGARPFFEDNGLDWQNFLENGIPAATLAATDHPLAIQVAEIARAEAKGNS